MKNCPSITPKTTHQKPIKERTTVKARNRDSSATNSAMENIDPNINGDIELPNFKVIEDEEKSSHLDLKEQIMLLNKENMKLKTENATRKKENTQLHEILNNMQGKNKFSDLFHHCYIFVT